MKTNAAVLWGIDEDWTIEEVDLDGPKEGEVLIKFEATGLCHSDHHVRTGDFIGVPLPIIGGHEGAGTVVEVGPGVRDLKPGDHVVTSFLPACGRCRWCASGHQNLCDLGALILVGIQTDGTYRRRVKGHDVGVLSGVGSFSQYGTLSEASVVKIDDDLPLNRACLLGCGVMTGWGSAVNTADVRPGDTVVIIGMGGIGSGAVQGARLAGAEKIIVVEPVESKRDKAFEFGATHFVTSIAEATALVADLTRGVMADSALLTVGVVEGPMINDAFNIVRKGGAVVLTGFAPMRTSTPCCRWPLSRCSRSGCSAASTARPTRAPTSRGCSTSTATVSCCSTRPSPPSTSSPTSTRATTTCSPAATSAGSSCTTTDECGPYAWIFVGGFMRWMQHHLN